MHILVTGGAGYIGSHTLVSLQNSGFDVLVLDNFSNSSPLALERVSAITGKAVPFVRGDVRDKAVLKKVFTEHEIDAVIHFAGLKAVGESVEKPLLYYENNVGGSLALCEAMAEASVFCIVFSSSATVYGEPATMPIREDFPTGRPTNPYGQSKLMVEEILKDLFVSDPRWSIGLLRYFNPVGAHESGMIGEDPAGIPNNLLPYITQVAIGRLERLAVYGNDYPTPDGTGVRDYIHVMDLAEGHVKALAFLAKQRGVNIWNLGTGRGTSVLEMIRAFEAASGKGIPFSIVPRRKGDIAACWADPSKALQELGWKTSRSLEDMMQDAWRWQIGNPKGYLSESL